MKTFAMIEQTARDFPEDMAHENGNYLCLCVHCHEPFTGYKRRICCKVCETQYKEQHGSNN